MQKIKFSLITTTIKTPEGKIIDIGLIQVLTNLFNEQTKLEPSKKISAKASYWLNKAFSKIQSEYENFNKARMELVNKYAVNSENKKPDDEYDFGDNQETINKEFAELMATEIDFNFVPLDISIFGDATVSPEIIGRLIGPIIKE